MAAGKGRADKLGGNARENTTGKRGTRLSQLRRQSAAWGQVLAATCRTCAEDRDCGLAGCAPGWRLQDCLLRINRRRGSGIDLLRDAEMPTPTLAHADSTASAQTAAFTAGSHSSNPVAVKRRAARDTPVKLVRPRLATTRPRGSGIADPTRPAIRDAVCCSPANSLPSKNPKCDECGCWRAPRQEPLRHRRRPSRDLHRD